MFTLCCKLRAPLAKFSSRITKRFVHREYKVNVNGLDLNIVESGSGKKSVLLMPGTLGSCWTDFEPQIEELPKLLPNHTVIAWDPPGFGKSIPPKRQWSLDIFHNDAHCAFDLMKALGRSKFSIVGWSGGGVSGLIVAGLYRDNIEKLVTWGAGAFITAEEVQNFQNIRDVRKWSPGMREPMEKLYGVERFAELWSEWVDAICAIHRKRNGNFCREEVKLIKAPTFILRGKKDPVIADQPIEYVRKRIKGGVREISRCLSQCSAHSEHKVRVNGLDINIVESGGGGGATKSVLLMPGALGSSWTDFKPQIEQLPKLLPQHRIIAWDPPGYGKSIPPKRQWSLEFFQNDACLAVELMQALQTPKFSIIGWSDGGITGLIAAGRYTNNIEKLIIWGAGAYLIPAEVKAFQSIRDVSKWSARMREPMEKVYGKERFAELWAEWVDAATAFYTKRNGDFCKQEVDQIVAPTFILHGKKDPMVASEHIPYLRKHLKCVKYHEFPEGKHNIHLRYAEEFNKLVAEFLLEKS